ncbi:hypothetical protein CLV84_0553 [Neolewinella xylanilytica]|uniref:Uncharacterized protein n=1 Tax=Neolewinella xylanilytica TaxID=1514080 RepID=A0A2S6I7Y1_9BACT|nr:DUF6544 family protein [Neolewinella xylanilytica]PPK87607.1 hypothetical protein CLV84_0553 [Neolewinella xylanilytica]
MRTFLFLLLAVHGLLHLLGFAAAVGYSGGEFTLFISRSWGLGWLAIAGILLSAAGFLAVRHRHWWTAAGVGVVLSQILVLRFWVDASFGTIPNLLILACLVVTYGARKFDRKAERSRRQLRRSVIPTPARTDEALPPVVRRWLARSGALHRPTPSFLHLEQTLAMQLKPDQQIWYTAEATQLITASPPAFHWAVQVHMHPLLTVYGEDSLVSGRAAMRMSLFGLLPVSEVHDDAKVDEAAMQRYLAELAWFPAAARSAPIEWEALGDHEARATLRLGKQTASGIFSFTPAGDFLRFETRRYREHGPEAQRLPWIAEAERWATFDGIRVPSRLRASWMLDGSIWTWLRIEVTDLQQADSVNEPDPTPQRTSRPDLQLHD